MDSIIKGSIAANKIYGIDNVSTESWLNYAHALLIISGSDHEVSSPEMKWLMTDFISIIDAPDDFIQNVKNFDFENTPLDEVLPRIKFDVEINYMRVLLYDAIKMAYADDDYSEFEKTAVIRAAKLLNVPMFLANTLEGLVRTEKSIEATRKSIFEVEDLNWDKFKDFEPGVRKTPPLIQHTYGIEATSDEIDLQYGYALMAIAGADGEVSDAEKNWYRNDYARIAKIPEEIVDMVLTSDYQKIDLGEVIATLSGDISINLAKTLLYNSIKMARADMDYAEAERRAVETAATLLNIPVSMANTMNYLIDAENKIEKMRKTLFELRPKQKTNIIN